MVSYTVHSLVYHNELNEGAWIKFSPLILHKKNNPLIPVFTVANVPQPCLLSVFKTHDISMGG